MQFKLLPTTRKLPFGKIFVERRYYCRSNYFTDWDLCERYNAVVRNNYEAVEWFRPVVASFLDIQEENLPPLWTNYLPKSLMQPHI